MVYEIEGEGCTIQGDCNLKTNMRKKGHVGECLIPIVGYKDQKIKEVPESPNIAARVSKSELGIL